MGALGEGARAKSHGEGTGRRSRRLLERTGFVRPSVRQRRPRPIAVAEVANLDHGLLCPVTAARRPVAWST